MSILDAIAKSFGTDKSSETHDYCRKYEKYLKFNRHDDIKLLEIGVSAGQSIKTWKKYYYNAKILGVDIIPECKKYEEDHINVEIGSQTDGVFLEKISKQYGPFDMILDDGSHINSDVIYSFEHLFDSVKSGGVYIIEDTHTSYFDDYGGGFRRPGATIEYFKSIIDEVNFLGELSEWHDSAIGQICKTHYRRDKELLQQFERKQQQYRGTQIESINFLNGIIIITKR